MEPKIGRIYRYKYPDRNGIYHECKVVGVVDNCCYIEDLVHPDVYGYNYGPSYQMISKIVINDFWTYELVEELLDVHTKV